MSRLRRRSWAVKLIDSSMQLAIAMDRPRRLPTCSPSGPAAVAFQASIRPKRQTVVAPMVGWPPSGQFICFQAVQLSKFAFSLVCQPLAYRPLR